MKYTAILITCLLWLFTSASLFAQIDRRSVLDKNRANQNTVRIADKTSAKKFKSQMVLKPDLSKMVIDRKKLGLPGSSSSPAAPATTENAEEEDPDAYLEFLPEGPSNGPEIDLESTIKADVVDVARNVLGLDTRIKRDGNTKSGYYYYYPREYHLGWSEATGEYDIEVTYLDAGQEGAGNATVTATLYPKLLPGDVEMARDMLAKKLKKSPGALPDVHEFTYLPMVQAAEVELEALSQFGVQEGGIAFRSPSRLGDPIEIIFTTDNVNRLLTMFFNNTGIFGNLVVYTTGYEDAGFTIPLNLKIEAPETYGAFEISNADWRTSWRNPTDYPINISHFHALRKERNGEYRVYSWNASGDVVPPGATVDFGDSAVPAWIEKDRKVKRMWMDYSINECEACDDVVKRKILGSIEGEDVAKPEKLEFTILNAMAFTKASLIRIKVRSAQASASGEEKTELEPVKVDEDGETFDGGTLYVRDGKVDFEYKMVVYLEDGTTYESGWIPSNSKEVVVGSWQIRENIPEFNE